METGEQRSCSGCGYPLYSGEHGPKCPLRGASETTPEQAQNDVLERERSDIERFIDQNIDAPGFREALDFAHPEQIDKETILRALNRLLESPDVRLSGPERLSLFMETLDYYAKPKDVEKPLLHSTGSYSLRNALETGFRGGHGRISGESAAKKIDAQKALSVSHADQPAAEAFQQVFARVSARRSELDKFLGVDAEKITGKATAESFMGDLFASLSKDELRQLVAKRNKLRVDQVSDADVARLSSPEVVRAVVEDLSKREHSPNVDLIKREVLPNVTDSALRASLLEEAEHPFPVMITFGSAGKQEGLTTVSRGERPTHIPFEDFYWGEFDGNDIKEIRVPLGQIDKVRGWLKEKGLQDIDLVPIEVYEVKRVIAGSAKPKPNALES